MLVKKLELVEFTAHTLANCQEAVEKIHNNKIVFCAAVLDVSMPEMEAIEAMDATRKPF